MSTLEGDLVKKREARFQLSSNGGEGAGGSWHAPQGMPTNGMKGSSEQDRGVEGHAQVWVESSCGMWGESK